MKTKVITGLKKEVLVIEAKSKDIAWGFMFNKYGVKELLNWELLGKPDEIKEEDAMDLIEYESKFDNFNRLIEGYKGNGYLSKKALDSFNSALESEIYWNVNPLEEPNIGSCDCSDCQDYFNDKQNEWNEAQEKTFDKKRTLIFVKN